ncbi:hypothetical protein OEZ86_003581 [Tetradesmus obliquus]|nr:hypothetical protein OEZ86_003581 [Tetradesmus obliquus]
MALREKAVILPEATDLVHALDTRVISKAYIEQGRPDLAVAALEGALSRTGATWPLVQGTAQLAQELHVRRLLKSCYQACAALPMLPRSGSGSSSSTVDAHLAQGDATGARACLTAYNTLLLAAGKSACEECAVCYELLTGSSAVMLLGCSHIFHRACCNEWFGHKLFEAGRFTPECPLCRQVDSSLQPSDAALSALREMQQYHDEHERSHSQEAPSEDEVQSEGDVNDNEEEEELECEEDSDDGDSDSGLHSSDSGSDSSSSSNDDSGGSDDDDMDTGSDVGSSVASSALTAVAAQLATHNSAAALEPQL